MQYEFKVLGIKDVNFKDDTGRQVSGVHLWVVGKTGEAAWLNGVEVVKLWIPDGSALEAAAAGLQLDQVISVSFDRRGRPMQIKVI